MEGEHPSAALRAVLVAVNVKPNSEVFEHGEIFVALGLDVSVDVVEVGRETDVAEVVLPLRAVIFLVGLRVGRHWSAEVRHLALPPGERLECCLECFVWVHLRSVLNCDCSECVADNFRGGLADNCLPVREGDGVAIGKSGRKGCHIVGLPHGESACRSVDLDFRDSRSVRSCRRLAVSS